MSIFRKYCVEIMVVSTAGIFLFKYLISKYFCKKESNKYIIIQTLQEWDIHRNEIIKTFRSSGVIGMDCEWVSIGNKRNPVSLLQLATKDGFCILIRLCCIPVWLIPVELAELLRDKNILKVGVGISEDSDKLFHDYCLEVQSFVDLRYLAKDLPELQGKSLGLKSLAKELLSYDLNKTKILRCSNWDAKDLTNDQIKYAADDAVISAKLFHGIHKQKNSWWKISSNFNEDIEMYMDVSFKQKISNCNITKVSNISSLKTHKNKYSKPRSKPMYDNCQLTAPDGELLCSCDKSKAEWYVYKGLGEIIKEDPLIVRLNFEPSGRPTLDNVFYTKEKINCCVVCGKTQNYHRKLVIPSEYRRYFPHLMKKNLSHDVLLLCVDCHKRSNLLDQNMRIKLAELCDAPIMNNKNAKYKFNSAMAQVKSAANALHNSGDKIPETRKKELERIILEYFGITTLSKEVLKEACSIDVTFPNDSFIPHGLKVYQYFCKNGGLIEFEKMWRQHFLDSMQPKFLPVMWSVEHNHKRLAIQVINHERDVNFDVSILGLNSDLLKEVEEYIQ